jgi:SAM-dependent methyltransferase
MSDREQNSPESREDLWRARDYADRQEDSTRPDYQEGVRRTRPRSGTVLLDLGCGAGGFCRLAADAGADATGVDASPAMIEIARQRVPEGRFHVGDMQGLPFDENAFDVVTAFNSLQFTDDPGAPRWLGHVVSPSRAQSCSPSCSVARSAWDRSQDGVPSGLCYRPVLRVPPHSRSPSRA